MATRTSGKGRISDELLAGQDAAEVFRSVELVEELKKAVAERALDAEMDAHLEGEAGRDVGNHRNGHNRKRVLTDAGSMEPGGAAGPAGEFRAAAGGEVLPPAAGLRRQGDLDVRTRHDDAGDPRPCPRAVRCRRSWSRR